MVEGCWIKNLWIPNRLYKLLATHKAPQSRNPSDELPGWNRRRSNEPGTLAGNVEGFYHLFPWLSPKHDFFEAGRLYPSLIARDRGSYLFLSNFGIASDPYIYRALDIKFVVNCSRDLPFVDEVASLLQSKPTGSTGNESQAPIRTDLHVELTDRFRVPVDDSVDHRICEHFADSVRFIAEAMEKQAGHVLIHCKHGQSRSATIAAAYLLYNSQQKGTAKTVQEVLADLKHCRPRVSPNEGFLKQLQEAFEQCWVDLLWCQWCPNLAEGWAFERSASIKGMMIPWPMAETSNGLGKIYPVLQAFGCRGTCGMRIHLHVQFLWVTPAATFP